MDNMNAAEGFSPANSFQQNFTLSMLVSKYNSFYLVLGCRPSV